MKKQLIAAAALALATTAAADMTSKELAQKRVQVCMANPVCAERMEAKRERQAEAARLANIKYQHICIKYIRDYAAYSSFTHKKMLEAKSIGGGKYICVSDGIQHTVHYSHPRAAVMLVNHNNGMYEVVQ